LPGDDPIVSVVMAVRDGAAFLAEAVDSVRAQSLADLELVVVDDGSTDATPEILADLAGQDERIRVLRQPGAGLSPALNRACSEARGRYLARLDADDVALAERLTLQTEFLEDHPDVVVLGGGGIFIDDDGAEFGSAAYPSDAAEIADMLASGRSPVMHPAATIRAAAFRATSGYRPAMEVAQDYDLWLRLADDGGITNLAQPVLRYRFHRNQISTGNLRRTATEVRAALASARARADGRPDPLDDADSLEQRVLDLLGVGSEEIAAQEVDNGLWLARTLANGGLEDAAAPLWRHCAARARATAHPRETLARVLRARADAAGPRTGRLRTAAMRVGAAALEPGRTAARVRGKAPGAAGSQAH
jgi:glycosyltransferase involved in cell wall biosynthesis